MADTHRGPLAAFCLLAVLAALMMTTGVQRDVARVLVSAGVPRQVADVLAPDVVLAAPLDAVRHTGRSAASAAPAAPGTARAGAAAAPGVAGSPDQQTRPSAAPGVAHRPGTKQTASGPAVTTSPNAVRHPHRNGHAGPAGHRATRMVTPQLRHHAARVGQEHGHKHGKKRGHGHHGHHKRHAHPHWFGHP